MASSSAQAIPSPPEFTFTPSDTRLKITYKNSLAYAHVFSQAMALASPVWKNFLFPPWSNTKESKFESKCEEKEGDDVVTKLRKLRLDPVEELDFTEDNAGALLVLLCVAHSKFEDILNDTPPRQLLIDLAIICDAYLCQDLIRPWIGGWIHREWNCDIYGESKYSIEGTIEDIQAMTLLGWVFRPDGNSDFFKMGVDWLFKQRITNDLPDAPDYWPLPTGIMKKIVQSRAETIKGLVLLAYEYLTDLEERQEEVCSKHNQKCKVLFLESYKTELQSLYPRKSAEDLMSVHYIPTVRYILVGYKEGLRCDRETQDKLEKRSKIILQQGWKPLWEGLRPSTRVKPQVESEMRRIQKVTGEWRKPVEEEILDWSD
ncbi:hypothetical protein EG329_007568 [Mollisiaceae sp. DMI_Dod_QoI]|nr:hypothetical protein EG329_007568 [Helotiales sp. DMI_Dod_QoI]